MTEKKAMLEKAKKHKSKGLTMLDAEDFLCIASRRFVAFDLETTGLNPRSDGITEIGAVRVEYGRITGTFERLVNPERPIPPEVTALTHISNEMVADAPEIGAVLPDFLAFIGEDAYVAHNAAFDVSFLKVQCDRLGLKLPEYAADSLDVARRCWPGLSSYRLGYLAQIIGFDMKTAHRSMADTEALAALVNTAVRNERVQIGKHPLYTQGWDLPEAHFPRGTVQHMSTGQLAVARAVYYMEQQFGTEMPYNRAKLSAIPCKAIRQFPGVTNLYELTAVIRESWSRDTIHDAFWDSECPAFHQDDVTARLLRDMCGLETVVVQTQQGKHVFNCLGSTAIDLTGGLDGEPDLKDGAVSCDPCTEEADYARYRQLQRNLMAVLNP